MINDTLDMELRLVEERHQVARSSLRDIRNPVLALPAVRRLMDLPPEVRAALAEVMRDLAADANTRAHESWAKSKGPMAAYWRAVSTYAKHIKNVVK